MKDFCGSAPMPEIGMKEIQGTMAAPFVEKPFIGGGNQCDRPRSERRRFFSAASNTKLGVGGNPFARSHF